MSALWLQALVQKSAWELEASKKTIFQFGNAVGRVLEKMPIQTWEADAWVRGLNTGLIRLEGYFFRAGSGKRSPLSFFIRNDKDLYMGLRRESITQAATYVQLITDYGYPRSRVRFESRWMDVVVDGEDGRALIYAETKANDKTLEKLCRRLASEFKTHVPPVDPEEKAVDDAIMKACHIRKNRPGYFWGVSPSSRSAYSVLHRPGGFTLIPIPDPPSIAI